MRIASFRLDQLISIHAPHAGSDGRVRIIHIINRPISIHAPHAGSDIM